MASTSSDYVAEHISCAVCHEVMTEPHALSCLHSFCLACLRRLRKRGHHESATAPGAVECPNCRRTTAFSQLRPDFKLNSLIEAYNQQREREEEADGEGGYTLEARSLRCDICEQSGRFVTAKCTVCDEYYCHHCEKVHRKSKASKNHALMSKQEIIVYFNGEANKALTAMQSEEVRLHAVITSMDEVKASAHNTMAEQLERVKRNTDIIVEKVRSHGRKISQRLRDSNRCSQDKLDGCKELVHKHIGQMGETRQLIEHISQTDNLPLYTAQMNDLLLTTAELTATDAGELTATDMQQQQLLFIRPHFNVNNLMYLKPQCDTSSDE